ncbi:hypothetical protein ACHAAC_07195 [Aeromicrobium sp. CF4.19]|uniref:hypothetical protein n=1 Tax=Aeromicrobium sp. CF4.19 TaxID=3373082 RepID=UPI003EE703E8
MRPLAPVVAAGALLAGCGLLGDDEQGAEDAGLETCRLVTAGIDAFNRNDVLMTVERFDEALDPAREFDRLSGTDEAADLLEAVEYYAALPAGDYREAFEGSPDFKRHQETTLGQCTEPGQPIQRPDEEQQA